MIAWLAEQYRYLFLVLRSHDSPRQLALGFAFGVLLGLLPQGNLLAAGVVLVFFSLRLNLATGMITAFVVSYVAALGDPLAHRLGFVLLQAPALADIWTWLYNQPVVPWTQFNNTVVLGSFLLGLLAFYPAYRLSLPWFARWRKHLDRRAERRRMLAVGRSGGSLLTVPETAMLRALRHRRVKMLQAQLEQITRHRRAA